MKENGIDVRQHERILLKRYLNVNTSLEIKQVLPTATGIQLIGTIQNDLVKSAELTGSWEKQLKDIEKELYRCSVYQQHETNGRCFSL
jgi:DNA topoisomerase-3